MPSIIMGNLHLKPSYHVMQKQNYNLRENKRLRIKLKILKKNTKEPKLNHSKLDTLVQVIDECVWSLPTGHKDVGEVVATKEI